MANVKCILTEQGGKGGTSSVQPIKFTITKQPNKVVYREDDVFSIDGLEGIISYGVEGSALEMGTATIPAQIGLDALIVSPTRPLVESDTEVTISYTENDVTVSAKVAITVRSGNLVITPPTKTTYQWGDTFNTAGLVVKTTEGVTITNYTMKIGNVVVTNGTVLNNTSFIIGTNVIDISCTDSDDIAQAGMFEITLNRKSLAIPAQSGTLTYDPTKTSQTPTWNSNYNSSLMTVAVTGQKNAGTYEATFTLVDPDHYQWSDNTIGTQTVSWIINKRTLVSSDVTSNSLSLSKGSTTGSVNITVPTGAGAISIDPTSVSGLTIKANTQSGYTRKYDFTADGHTPVDKSFKVIVEEGDNYLAGEFANKFTVKAVYWEWGSETGTADAAWWADLKTWVATASTSDLSACIGKTKSVTLTSAVLGTTTHLVRCIGYNCNRDKNATTRNTLTFETANCMANTTVFGSSNGKWIGSTVKQQCANYYNAFPGKASVSTVSIGIATDVNSSQSGSVTYVDETVFLASDAEHGFPKGADYSNGKGYAASYDEFDKYNTSKTPYQYCSSNANRIKKKGDNGSAQHYWERSLYYYSANIACRVFSDGKPNPSGYNNSFGFAPAFVI